MKKLIIILLISMWSSDVLAQRDYALYDKEGQLLWNWGTRDLKTSAIGSNTDDLIDYLMKRATKKFPYFQKKK